MDKKGKKNMKFQLDVTRKWRRGKKCWRDTHGRFLPVTLHFLAQRKTHPPPEPASTPSPAPEHPPRLA